MPNNPSIPEVSVIMPVYNQASFIRSSIRSLLNQTFHNWELLIINDGSTDGLKSCIQDFIDSDPRIHYLENPRNEGLGHSINRGLDTAKGEFIAYLPADDLLNPDHLESLLDTIKSADTHLAYTGIIYKKDDISGEGDYMTVMDEVDDRWFQLVQVMHRRTTDRWMERSEGVTDDLGVMFWDRFSRQHPGIATTRKVTAEWVSHLYQRHRIMNDRASGGIYMYKTYYGVSCPVRYKSHQGSLLDEVTHYAPFRAPQKHDGLKILIVGELSYNPERLYSLEKRGHKLYGLWINNPLCWNPTGNLAFGNITNIPFENWEEEVRRIKPDIIYAQLNYTAVDLAHHVMKKNTGIPLVWHFKEGPFYARNLGTWEKLMTLYREADGAIYINDVAREWYHQFMPAPNPHELVMDGDLPPAEWFKECRSPRLSEQDGEMHTLVAGRLLGITAHDIEQMARHHIHFHIYGDVFQHQARNTIDEAIALAPDYVHLHPSCPAEEWTREFSQYDAAWLHWHRSRNGGDLSRAAWQDFNSPARLSTYAIAGLPMIMADNTGHRVHYQEYLQRLGMALPISSFSDLARKWNDKPLMDSLRENSWRNRHEFCFDSWIDRLEDFFRTVIKSKSGASVI